MLNAEIFRDKRVLITGAGSFKGAWLSVWLDMMGAGVYGFAKNIPGNNTMFSALRLEKKIHFRQLDVLDNAGVAGMIKEVKPDLIFHLAGQSLIREAVGTPLDTLTTNILGSIHVLEALRKMEQPCSAIFVSSDKSYRVKDDEKVYTETDFIGGEDPYSASKSSVEIIARAYYKTYFSSPDSHIKLGIVRASNIIGGGDWSKDRIIPDCVRAWQNMKPLHIQSPYTVKPWQHVLDPLHGYLLFAQHLLEGNELNGETINFGTLPENIMDVQSLINILALKWGTRLPNPPYTISPSERQVKSNLIRLNWEKANRLLGWFPKIQMEKGLAMTAEWYTTYNTKASEAADLTNTQIKENFAF